MKPLYGIWIPKEGWLKSTNGVVSFDIEEVAQDTARRVGGKVRFVDQSLIDLEKNILSLEAMKKWWQFWRK